MIVYAIILLSVVIIAIAFGTKIYYLSPNESLNRTLFLGFILTALFAIIEYSLLLTASVEKSNLFGWLHQIVIVPLLLSYFLTTKLYSAIHQSFPRWYNMLINPLIYSGFVILLVCELNKDWRMAFDPIFKNGMWHFVFNINSFAYWVFFFWIVLIVVSTVFNFYHGYKTTSEKKEKYKRLIVLILFICLPTYIVIAFLFGATGSNVGNYIVSPYLLICIFGLGLVYSDYQLFQISPLKAFDNIMNSMTNQVLVLNNQFKLVYTNKTGDLFKQEKLNKQGDEERDFDLSLNQILGQSDLNLESLARELGALNYLDNLEKEIQINYSSKTKYLLLNFSPVFGNKEKLGYALVTSDVTKIKQFEEKLELYAKELREKNEILCLKNEEINEKNKQLKNSNENLEQFAYLASHDLKEPLRIVRSFTSLLERKYIKILDEPGKEFLHFIIDSVSRMEILLDDLLEFSRAGTEPTSTDFVSVEDVMIVVESNLKHRFENINGTLIVHNENLPSIKANQTQLIQLLQHLVSNGVKFRGERDPVVIVDCVKKDDKFVFSVKDNGIGISRENQEKAFELFSRLNTREEYEGSGIGLATCKRIVSSWGGDIRIESIEGEGSTFFFSFPCPVDKPLLV